MSIRFQVRYKKSPKMWFSKLVTQFVVIEIAKTISYNENVEVVRCLQCAQLQLGQIIDILWSLNTLAIVNR